MPPKIALMPDPVMEREEPVMAPALSPVNVESPAIPKVPETVKFVTVEAPLFRAKNEPRVVADKVVPVTLPVLIFIKVARPVLDKVLTVVAKALKEPVEERELAVRAPALTPAKVESPATPKVPEAVRLVIVEAPAFKAKNDPSVVPEIVVPVIFPAFTLAKVERPVLLKVETVEAKAFNDPVEDKEEAVVAPALTPAKVLNPAIPKIEEAVRVVTVELPLSREEKVDKPVEDRVLTVVARAFRELVEESVVPVIFPAVILAIVARPVPERVVIVVAPLLRLLNEANPVVDIVVPVIFVVVKLAVVARPVVERVLTVVAKAFNDPVDDKEEPVVAPAEPPASVDVPATPKVDEAVREVTVDAPLLREAREDRPVEDRVEPVIFVEVILAKVESPVPERVVRVTLAN